MTSPAPGTYKIPPKSIEGPKFVMGLKLENQSAVGSYQKKVAANPGAGTYNPDYRKVKKHMPAFSMRVKHKGDSAQKVPGPGTYDSNFTPTKSRGPTYGFGSASQR